MTAQKKVPIRNVILWTMLGSTIFSVTFGCVIALMSKHTFLSASSFVFIALMVIFVPTFIWIAIIEPLWWDKLSTKTQERTRNWGIGLVVVLIVVMYPLGMLGGDKWSGEGSVNLFPEGADSKNYRVAAEIEVTTKLWWNKDYKIDSVTWPDGGRSYMVDCLITKSSHVCMDDEERSWRIEIDEAPERPSSSSDDY